MTLRRLAALAAALLLSACATPWGTVASQPARTLTVTSSFWNGWDPSYVPVPVDSTLEAVVGSTVKVDGLSEELIITVTTVTPDAVTFSVSQGMAVNGNYNDLKSEFTVNNGSSLEFSTPSFDAGVNYRVSLS